MIKLIQNNTLIKFLVVLGVIVIVYGSLFAVSAYQKSERDKNTYTTPIEESNGEIPTYNVEGMSDEEILQMLEENRNKNKEN